MSRPGRTSTDIYGQRPLRPFRCFAVLYFVATVLATLISGQHYLVDLVVAVPSALAMQSLAEALLARRWPAGAFWIGIAVVAGWFLVLIWRAQWFLAMSGFTPAACVATLAVSLLLRGPSRHPAACGGPAAR